MRKQLMSIVLLAPLVVGGSAQDSSNQHKAGHAIIGAVNKVDRAAGKAAVKTAEGAEETLRLTDRCMVGTGKGVVKGTEYTAKETEAGGRKVGRMLKRVGKAI
jgi:hypothetical protein